MITNIDLRSIKTAVVKSLFGVITEIIFIDKQDTKHTIIKTKVNKDNVDQEISIERRN